MTNPTPGAPEATPSPTSDEAVLDAGTFDELLESRREGLFVRDGSWHQLARAYRTVQLISLTAGLALVAAAAPIIATVTGTGWVWIPAGVLFAVLGVTLVLTPRQIRSFGYRLRENDLVLRRGILFQRVVAVPYGRMQLVDITHGPLDRAFGIAQLKLVTAAAASAVVIPGLTQDAAEKLRDVLIAVAESRRTGL